MHVTYSSSVVLCVENNDQFAHCAENAQFRPLFAPKPCTSRTRSPAYTGMIRTMLANHHVPPSSFESSRLPLLARTSFEPQPRFGQGSTHLPPKSTPIHTKRGPAAPFFATANATAAARCRTLARISNHTRYRAQQQQQPQRQRTVARNPYFSMSFWIRSMASTVASASPKAVKRT